MSAPSAPPKFEIGEVVIVVPHNGDARFESTVVRRGFGTVRMVRIDGSWDEGPATWIYQVENDPNYIYNREAVRIEAELRKRPDFKPSQYSFQELMNRSRHGFNIRREREKQNAE